MLGLRLRSLASLPAGGLPVSLRCAPGRIIPHPVHPLRFHGRYPYSAITRRPDYAWPKSRRLAVYVGFNLEHFAFGAGLGAGSGRRAPSPTCSTTPGATTATASAYGAAWTSSTQLGIPVGALVNTALYDYCPEVVEAFVKRGDELDRPRPHQLRAPGRDEPKQEKPAVEVLPRAHRARSRESRRRAGSAPGSRKASSRPTCCRRPATATRSTGATTTSRSR